MLNNRYRLLATVAAGGMATVYKAQDTMLNRLVAVKVLRERYARDPQFVQRFREEAAAAANLNHPNIVTIYDVGSDTLNTQQRHYIVMELIDGADLKQTQRVRGEGEPYDVTEAVDLARQVCEGVAYAHRRGLVHCDIKPQNVMLTADGRAKVTDFGIARAFTSVLNPNAREDVVWGTPQYYAPEQAAGAIPTPASDVYSIGVLLFELLAGRLPFLAADSAALAKLHQTAEPPSLTEANPSVSIQLEGLVRRALAKDPSQRYRNADQMAATLASYLQQGEENTLMGMSPVAPAKPPTQNTPSAGANRPPGNTGPSIEERIAKRGAVNPDVKPNVGGAAANAKPAAPAAKRPAPQPVREATSSTAPTGATGSYTQSGTVMDGRGGVDLRLLLLALVAALCVLGLIPLYAQVYTEYTRPVPVGAPTPVAPDGATPPGGNAGQPVAQNTADATAPPGATASPSPTATQTSTPTIALPTNLVGSVLTDEFKTQLVTNGISLTVLGKYDLLPENTILAIDPLTTALPVSSSLVITVSSGGRVDLRAEMPGIMVESARFNREEFPPGSAIQFDVTWRGLGAIGRDYNVGVYLFDPSGGYTGVQDGDRAPQHFGAASPTSGWSNGTVVIDTYRLVVPLNAQPGDYEIRIVLYDGSGRVNYSNPGLSVVKEAQALVVKSVKVR
jgi:eukaryotic-like serine/threonine-protein kinase